jgi:hypothetical protein
MLSTAKLGGLQIVEVRCEIMGFLGFGQSCIPFEALDNVLMIMYK